MICESTVKKYCCEDISLIENYEEAINSNDVWEIHHKLEIELSKSKHELIDMGLYYNRPANEFIFLTKKEHKSLHMSIHRNNGIVGNHSQNEITKSKISNSMIGSKKSEIHKLHMSKPKKKFKWLTEDGSIKEMSKNHAKRFHPNWKEIGEA